MPNKLGLAEAKEHTLVICKTDARKFTEICECVRHGLESNEIVVLLIANMSKNFRKKLVQEVGVDITHSEKKGDVIIRSTAEWYFSDGTDNKGRMAELWKSSITNCRKNGKNGVRVLIDMKPLFDRGLIKELIDLESLLNTKSGFPLNVICVYDTEDIDVLSLTQIGVLQKYHNQVRIDKTTSALDSGSIGILKLIVHRPHVVRICKIVQNKRMYTRQILRELSGWQYSHKYLKEAVRYRLITQERARIGVDKGRWAHFHELTGRGQTLLDIARQLRL